MTARWAMDGGWVRFGTFEFSHESGELRRDGRPVRLQAQPAKLLSLLLRHAGTTVTRETLQHQLWGTETHVDFERGLNFCVAQVRAALRDGADSPRFVATVPREGYRFIAPVDVVTRDGGGGAAPRRRSRASRIWRSLRLSPRTALAAAAVATVALGVVALPRFTAPLPTVVVVPFYNETGRPELDSMAKSVGDATVARLAAGNRLDELSVIGNADVLKNPFARQDVQKIARELRADWVVIGQLKSDGERLRVIGHLIRAADMKHVWAQTFDETRFTLDTQARTAEAIAAGVSHALATR